MSTTITDMAAVARQILEVDAKATAAPWERVYDFVTTPELGVIHECTSLVGIDDAALIALYRNQAPALAQAYLQLVDDYDALAAVAISTNAALEALGEQLERSAKKHSRKKLEGEA